MNSQNITVNQESSVCVTLSYPRIHTTMSCKNLPPASGDFCDSWLTIIFTHFIYRLIHCGQNTVGTGNPTIQQWIFLSKLAGKNLREINKRSCLAMSNQNLDENAINAKQRKTTYSFQGDGTNFIRKLGNYKSFFLQSPIIFS